MNAVSKSFISLFFVIICTNITAQNTFNTDYHNISFGNKDGNRNANINIGLSSDVNTLQGVQLALFSSVIRQSGKGLSDGLFASVTANDFSGLQLALITNIAGGKISGMQGAALLSSAKNVSGVQLTAFNNICAGILRGCQLSVVSNIAMGVEKGAQISAIMNVCAYKMQGFQASVMNYCDTLTGNQLGIINLCINHPKGVQVGLVNYTRDDTKRKIGLVNISPQTDIQMFAYLSNTSYANISARFLNKISYSMLGVSSGYKDLNKNFSASLFYRTGYYKEIFKNTVLSTDLGFYHIETFLNSDNQIPERLYSLQFHINCEYKINKILKLFISSGYQGTRYYQYNKFFNKGLLLEGGAVLF